MKDKRDDVTDDAAYDGGDLKIELCHNPSEQKLIVRIADAKNLPLVRGSKPDTFVKLEVHFCGRKLQSLTTKVVQKTQNPTFNEIFILDLSNDKMPQVTLVFKVKHKGRVREAHIGQVHLGYSVSVESEYRHWEQVVEKPQMAVEATHKIRKDR